MKKVLMLLLAISFLSVNAVSAEEATPILKTGNINVSYEDAVNVREEITIANAETIPDAKLEHIVTKIESAKLENLIITSNNKHLEYQTQEGNSVDKIYVNLPDEIQGDFTYEISYQLQNVEIEKIPILVPAFSTDGNGNVISLNIDLPEGIYIHESFPIIDSGDSGSVEEQMMNIPSFVGLETGASPAGFFTTSNIYTIFGLAVILAIILAWLLNERKNKAGEAANV
ncbi:hypothetical protein [Jeotgalibacillus soli]|uniref:Gram-positive pilin subunit D1 N-terminal domain-containing protein n=1 Tax=Jeotgalibacillus soli TaxID=889306 RepID=A0A0C2VVP4_9BACL|nr:hypothetical protein [Jeotgalibacillus soli]KIL48486.1 hypothetical protein KP78_15690 [Jeotgalibacillus soli]